MPVNNEIAETVVQSFLRGTPFLHSTCRVFISSHVRVSNEDFLGPGNYDLTKDLLSVETEESFMGQTASISLIPRRPYKEWIFPNDWVSIYMSSGADLPHDFGVLGDPEKRDEDIRVFWGFVDDIKESTEVDAASGRTQVRISIACSGIQKAFDKTMLYFNPLLDSRTRFGALLPGLATLSYGVPLTGTPTTIPRGIALAYLGYGGQFLMPESYQKRISSEEERAAYLKEAFSRAINVEETMGFLKSRGVSNRPQQNSVIRRMVERHRDQFEASSVATVIDMFSYVEDFFVDGRIVSTPFQVTQSNLWQTMYENCNPILNECYLTLMPDVDGIFKGETDEWGMQPKYTPSLIIRERPFSWLNTDIATFANSFGKNVVLRSPTKGGKTRDFPIGDVFFSSIYRRVKLPPQQNVRSPHTVRLMRNRARIEQQTQEAQDQVKVLRKSLAMSGVNISGLSDDDIRDIAKEYIQKARQEEREAIAKDLVNPNLELVGALSRDSRWVNRVQIQTSDIFAETLGLADNDHVNFFMISQASIPIATSLQKFVLMLDGIIPMYHSESIRRHGLRLREMATKYMSTGAGKIDNKDALDFLVRTLLLQDQWYQHQPYYRAGTISCKPVPKARVGMVLDVTGADRDEVFYIEGVSQKWSRAAESGAGRLYSAFTVTRGQPSEKRFRYAPPDAVQMLVDGVEVPRANASKQPEVERSLYPTADDQLRLLQRLLVEQTDREFQKEVTAKIDTITSGNNSKLDLAILKQAIQQAKYFLNDPAINREVDAMLATFKKRIEPVKTTPVYKVKSDRMQVGLPPWAVQEELRGKMWDPIRRPEREIDTDPTISTENAIGELNKSK